MEVEWVQTFLVAAKVENFHAAAEQLHLAQPTVSQHIRKLETYLGLALFERRGRGVRLTAAGRRFLPSAQQLVEAYQRAHEEMVRWQQGYDRTLKLAVSPVIATTWLPDCVRRFSAQHPNVDFSIQVMESRDIAERVARGECDFGLGRQRVQQSSVACEPLALDPVVFVVPAEPHDLEGPPPEPQELFTNYPVLTHNHPEYWDSLLTSLRALYDIRTVQVSQVHVTVHWIAERMGVSFLPLSTVRREMLRGTVEDVPFTDFPLPVACTYLIADWTAMTDHAREFCNFVRAYARARSPIPFR